jgi:transposase-like protein
MGTIKTRPTMFSNINTRNGHVDAACCPAYWKQISKSLDHIKKSKVEENQSHHAYDCDDKRKIKSEWFSQFQWLQHKDSNLQNSKI